MMFSRKNPHFLVNIGIAILTVFVISGLIWKGLGSYRDNAQPASTVGTVKKSRKRVKIKKEEKTGLIIYPVKVTSVKVKQDGQSDDFFITVKGKTNAPNGSIVYAFHGDGTNLAYGMNTVDGDGDYKMRDHKVKFFFLASHIFDEIDYIEAGQKAKFTVFCTNQKFSEWEKFNDKDSQFISKKVRKKVNKEKIKPYTFVVTKEMAYIENHN